MAVSANRLEICKSPTPSRAKNRSIARSSSPRWRTRCKRRRARVTARRPRCAPKSIRAPARCAFSRLMLVVDAVDNDATQISMAEARKRNPAAQPGDWISETLPPFDFGRIAAQSAKQIIVQKVREPSATANTKSSRTASAKSSTGSSSGSNMAMSSSTLDAARALFAATK